MSADRGCVSAGGVERRESKGGWTRRETEGGGARRKKEVYAMKNKSVGQASQADGLEGAQQGRKPVEGAVRAGGWASWGSWARTMPWAFHEQTKRDGHPVSYQHEQRSCGGRAQVWESGEARHSRVQ